MRISSELFPFASHDKYGYDLDYAAAELKVRTPLTSQERMADVDFSQTAGDLANQYGHRMTLHPGQVGHGFLILSCCGSSRTTPPFPVHPNRLAQAERRRCINSRIALYVPRWSLLYDAVHERVPF
jgi:hypothetical protein